MSVPAAGGALAPALGMAMMVAAMIILPIMDGFAKLLSQSYPTMQIVWARYFFQFALLAPLVVWRFGLRGSWPRRPGFQLLRGVLLLGATVCFFTAIAQMPLADAIALVFIYPFIVTALSPLVLGDRVGVWRGGAVVVGFAGAMIVIQPGFRELSTGMAWAAGCGACFACYVLITRKMAGSDRPSVTLLMTGLIGTLATTALLPFHWTGPTHGDLALMASLGAMAAIGHYLIIVAHEKASAPQLAPYAYVEIISATVVGFVMFGDLPDVATWAGMAIIVASGIVIAWREALLQRRARAAPR